jgi:hypothetical protein
VKTGPGVTAMKDLLDRSYNIDLLGGSRVLPHEATSRRLPALLKNAPSTAASAQSKVTASSELLKVGISFREASAMRAYGRCGAAHVAEGMAAGILRRSRRAAGLRWRCGRRRRR